MPEATIQEHRDLDARKGKVDSSTNGLDWSDTDPVTQAQAMDSTP